MAHDGDCPICKTPGSTASGGNEEIQTIACPRCGTFRVSTWSHELDYLTALVPHQRATLSGLLREHADRHPGRAYPDVLSPQQCDRMLHSGPFPLSTDRSIERLLLAVAERAPLLGETTPPEPPAVWAARAFQATNHQLNALLGELGIGSAEAQRLLVRGEAAGGGINLGLTFRGFQRVEQLRRTTAASNQAFVAMWFHDDVTPIYDNGIVPALVECGLAPYRVDRDGKNPDRIDAKIVAEIRRSRVLIADVTGERPGVYYEAGLAEGLGIPVIWTCNASWRTKLLRGPNPDSTADPTLVECGWPDRMHFDTRQFPHLLWRNAEHLKELLTDTLRARAIVVPRG